MSWDRFVKNQVGLDMRRHPLADTPCPNTPLIPVHLVRVTERDDRCGAMHAEPTPAQDAGAAA